MNEDPSGKPEDAEPSGPGQPGGWGAPIPPAYYAGPADPLVSADFAGWWSRSFALLRAAWRPMAAIQLITTVPTTAVTVAVGLTIARQPDGLASTTDPSRLDFRAAFAPFLATAPVVLVSALFGLVVPLAMTQVLVQTVTGRPVSIGAALLAGLRRVLPMLGWGLLGGLIVLVGFLFCILPGIFVAAALAVLPVIVLLERGNGIGRAFQLFGADTGASIGRLAAMFGLAVAVAVAEFAASTVIEAGAAAGPAALPMVLSALISGTFSVASGILFAPMYLTTYADMRARHEPFSTAYLVAA